MNTWTRIKSQHQNSLLDSAVGRLHWGVSSLWGNYWARHIAEFCTRVDNTVQTMVIPSTQLDPPPFTPFTIERMRLHAKYKGMGIRSLYDRRHSGYVGGMLQCIPPLLGRISPSNITMTGRINTSSMEVWLGKNSFDSNPEKKPYEALLSNGDSSCIATCCQFQK